MKHAILRVKIKKKPKADKHSKKTHPTLTGPRI